MKKKLFLLCGLIVVAVVIIGVVLNSNKSSNKTQLMFLNSWDNPPVYNGNPYATGGVGDAGKYIFGKLASVRVLDGTTKPYLAETIERNGDKLIVKLKEGITWDDGTPFTSKDVKFDFEFKRGWLGLQQIYDYLDSIDTPDDYTVEFNMNPIKKSHLAETYILTEQIKTPAHIFGKYMDDIQVLTELRDKKEALQEELEEQGISLKDISDELKKIRDKNTLIKSKEQDITPEELNKITAILKLNDEYVERYKEYLIVSESLDDEYNKLKKQLSKYRPEMPLGYGPYKLTKVTPSNMVLDIKEAYPNNDKNTVDQIILHRWGNNTMNWASLAKGIVDVVGVAAPPDVVEELTKNEGVQHVITSAFLNAALFFNTEKYPFSDVRFRKAIAYIIDRDKCRVQGSYFGKTVTAQTGVLESVQNVWLDDTNNYESYNLDTEKATELLTEMGFKRNKAGFWCDENGKEFDFTMLGYVPHTDWMLVSDEIARQLTKFGIKVSLQPVEPTMFRQRITTDDFDMCIENSFVGSRSPYEAFKRMYIEGDSGQVISKFNTKVKGPDGKIIDLDELTKELGETTDKVKQKEIIKTLAWVTNTYVPVVDLYEAAGQVFINDSVRVDGWPTNEEIVVGLASDREENIMMWLLEGKLKAKGSDKK